MGRQRGGEEVDAFAEDNALSDKDEAAGGVNRDNRDGTNGEDTEPNREAAGGKEKLQAPNGEEESRTARREDDDRRADGGDRRRPAKVRGFNKDQCTSLYVGNLSYETTREHVEDLFGKGGFQVIVHLEYKRETGKNKGYCFVEFEDNAATRAAMEKFNKYELDGRPLRLDYDPGVKYKGAARVRPSRGGRPPPPRSYPGPPRSIPAGHPSNPPGRFVTLPPGSVVPAGMTAAIIDMGAAAPRSYHSNPAGRAPSLRTLDPPLHPRYGDRHDVPERGRRYRSRSPPRRYESVRHDPVRRHHSPPSYRRSRRSPSPPPRHDEDRYVRGGARYAEPRSHRRDPYEPYGRRPDPHPPSRSPYDSRSFGVDDRGRRASYSPLPRSLRR